MKMLAFLAVAAVILPSVAAAQDKPANRPAVAIPPVSSMPTPQALIVWHAESIRCADADFPGSAVSLPRPGFGWMQIGAPPRVTFDFTVSYDGRPVNIRRLDSDYVPNADDLGPALAASTFASGTAHRDCQVRYVATRTPIAVADVRDLIAATIGSRPSPQVTDRIKPANSDCLGRLPPPLLRGYPDFAKLKGSIGRQQWSMVAFDIDAAGKPIGIRTLTGSNDAGLDSAARDAVAKSRFVAGKRTGCLYPYWRSALPRPAPDAPDKQSYRPDSATCPAELDWAIKPVLQYPDNYRRRGIEGWAIIGFDAAPWGATGNVHVLAVEPSTDFGAAAMNIIAAARLAPSNQGYVGCIERVRYVMAPPDGAGTSATR